MQVGAHRLDAVAVRNRDHHLRAGDHVDRAAGIVRRHRDVVRLCLCADLLQLRYTARPSDVRHDEVGEALLQDRHELPTSVNPLAHADRHVRRVPHLLQRRVRLHTHRLLEPENVIRLQRIRQPYRRRNIKPRMVVDQYLNVGTHSFSRRRNPLHALVFSIRRQLARHVAIDLVWMMRVPGIRL